MTSCHKFSMNSKKTSFIGFLVGLNALVTGVIG